MITFDDPAYYDSSAYKWYILLLLIPGLHFLCLPCIIDSKDKELEKYYTKLYFRYIDKEG